MKLLRKNKSVSRPNPESIDQPIMETPVAIADNGQEIAAVISLAINMYIQEIREYENAIVTIQRVMKPYSPWSSKIYGLRQTPNHIPGLRSRLR